MWEPAIGPVVTELGRILAFDWTVMDPSLLHRGHWAEGTWRFRGGSRPYAGMTRFRFKGHRAAALGAGCGGISAPCGRAPLGDRKMRRGGGGVKLMAAAWFGVSVNHWIGLFCQNHRTRGV